MRVCVCVREREMKGQRETHRESVCVCERDGGAAVERERNIKID